jgi:hypothetical protein
MNNDFDMALFEPEVVLGAQISRGAACDGITGVRALMIAILEDATLCIERGRRRRHWRARQLAAEAETWVRSDCRDWPFSFASICDVLGFDPDALRVRLLSRAQRPGACGGLILEPGGAACPCSRLRQTESGESAWPRGTCGATVRRGQTSLRAQG